jgi:hypothetical protein
VFHSRVHNVEHRDLSRRDEMGGTCGTNEAAARIGVSWQDLKARDGLDGRTMFKWVLHKEKAVSLDCSGSG